MSAGGAAAGLVEWGVAAQTYPGERICGDAHVVASFEDGVLAGVIDGLGHGPEAAEASREAVAALSRSAGGPLAQAVRDCHERLRRTRGAAMSLALIHRDGRMSWTGVGNVEAVLFRSDPNVRRQTIVPRAGVVGYQLPPLRHDTHRIAEGDLLVMATDGVSTRFCERSPQPGDPASMAQAVLSAHGRGDDDGLVLVVRYLGGEP